MRSPDHSLPLGSPVAAPLPVFAGAVLRRLLRGLSCGSLIIDTPAGRITHDSGQPGPQARLSLHAWRALWRFLADGDAGFARAYIEREWSSPDLVALLELACANEAIGARQPPAPLRALHRLTHALRRNSRRGSRRNIAAHYDLGNAFFAAWLDAGMTYSSALYTAPDQTLEEAQNAKLDRIVALLDPKPDQAVLEIGCGWGSLAERMIERSACRVTGLTLSTAQLACAEQRLAAAGFAQKADIRLQDYRDLTGTFDRVVSIEMLEAVGEAYWPRFFAKLHEVLRPGGVAVLQVITIDEIRFDDYRRNPDFIQQYIFPGGMLPTVTAIGAQLARTGLALVATEHFGASYARTLATWRERFEQRWSEIEALGFDRRFKRMWEYYLAYCEAGFRAGALDVGLYRVTKPC